MCVPVTASATSLQTVELLEPKLRLSSEGPAHSLGSTSHYSGRMGSDDRHSCTCSRHLGNPLITRLVVSLPVSWEGEEHERMIVGTITL